ncbi:MAG: ankyrin repeat domain-containing protein [Jaaginema sp. PMC 1079.18]|nr:ankyrin repeat domain-containing protein [Jaaginema sp. PMC 1080.18]MEC4849623.1 ankyrin repeat domain-containing protein [Jaaginema sp. PMC 1079.18]MEC4866203.1 ankyrin repeat domain-containing protein [Jaaginema sp. PMC 1078.18]
MKSRIFVLTLIFQIEMEIGNLDIIQAVEKQDIKILKNLMDKDINIHSLYYVETDEDIFFESIRTGRDRVLRLLLESGIDPNTLDSREYSSLMCAAEKGTVKTFKILLEYGADSSYSYNGETAVMVAANAGNREIVEYLCESSISRECRYAKQILPSGIRRKQRESDELTSRFIEYIQISEINSIETLISEGIDVNVLSPDGYPALHIAIDKADLRVIDILLSSNAKCDIRDESNNWTALMKASIENKDCIVQKLISKGATINALQGNRQLTILMIVISRLENVEGVLNDYQLTGQVMKVLSLLIKAGIDIDKKDEFGNSALMIAKIKGLDSIVNLFENSGAVGLDDIDNLRISWFRAVEEGNIEQLSVCLEDGITVDTVDYLGRTSLCIASERGYLNIVNFLLEEGADVNFNNSSPLFSACRNGHFEIVKSLVHAGSNITTEESVTLMYPIEYAQNLYPDIVTFLKSRT